MTTARTITSVSRPGIVAALICAAIVAITFTADAHAAFEIEEFSGASVSRDGSTDDRAGGHPYAVVNKVLFASEGFFDPDGQMKDVLVDLPPGLVGNPTVMSTCSPEEINGTLDGIILCPNSSQVGTVETILPGPLPFFKVPLYNITAGRGQPARFGFSVFGAPVFLVPKLRSDGDYGLTMEVRQISQAAFLAGAVTTFWGNPADSSHDSERTCKGKSITEEFGGCSSGSNPVAFLTNPVDCAAGPLTWRMQADQWEIPGVFHTASYNTDSNGNSTGVSDCESVPFEPATAATPTTDQAETPTGLDFELELPPDGLLNPNGVAQSHVKKAVVRLPEGVTINPSAGEGLSICTPADFNREKLETPPGAGCPNPSKVGTVTIDTPLLKEQANGSLYIAQQDDPKTTTPGAENPFDSLLALYMVARVPDRGLIVKSAGKVSPDPRTGQLTTTFDNLPQLPFDKATLHFREGQRAPLVSPRACGIYTTEAEFTPWSAADPNNPTPLEIRHTTSQFRVTRGVGGGPCPSGGTPAFHPGLTAGTLNNAAGSYSPFNLRLTRNDGEQELTNFSIKLPPGIVGKLAGVPFCPDAAIEAAKAKTGGEELASPSCPKASEVGRTLVGAGVGSIQTYVPGKVYLAGPYHGSALSIAAITSAKVGPFDVGTVVIREALKVNPDTAEVFIDATGSDPIPHIIRGIPVHARDIRAYVDKPEFVLNPTSCKRTSTASTVLGSGLDFASSSDDQPITVTSPFQAADCASLGFKPRLSLSLIGGAKRGDNPKFKAVLNARPGDANIGEAQVTLPHSEFLDNEHIKTICTRVQFNAGAGNGAQCPAGSVYGYAKAVTPLLDEPLEGPVFLRSSSHNLPDLVAALNSGKINIALDGRIDSVKGGRIRNTFEEVPDAPVTRFTLTMQGGKKGLLINSTNLCKSTNRAIVAFTGQNGKAHDFNPVVKPQCGKKAKKQKRGARRRALR